ncbi:nitrilase family protein [Candidatus Pacearchaeota archaeon]|nr:nitrilase family protein [Candidatus Pacearchaeota archaeon]
MVRSIKRKKNKKKGSFLKVAAIQMETKFGRKKQNIEKSCNLIDIAASKGVNLVVLPELCNTGYVFNNREEVMKLAEKIPGGPTIEAWTAKAKENNLFIVGGIAEALGKKFFNSSVLIGPKGYIGTYRKLHNWFEEKLYFEPGNLGYPVFELPFGRLGMLICYDMWFPEGFRILMEQGADIVCISTDWIPFPGKIRTWDESGRYMAHYIAMANAHVNAMYVICADRVGIERNQRFLGGSIIIDPSGWPLAGPASPEKEEILVAGINLFDSRRAKRWNNLNNIIRDRRTDIYDTMLGYKVP